MADDGDTVHYPQGIRPGSGMPNLGVSERDGRDMAAYLYTLEPMMPPS